LAINGLFCVALDDDTLVETPTWTQMETTYRVSQIEIDRGRAYEFDRTDAGRARVTLIDRNGDFDPTNASSPIYQRFDVLRQAAIALHNPMPSGTWSTLFRGFISSISWEPFQTKAFANVTVELVDALAILAAAELVPNGDFGIAASGNIEYAQDATTDAVQTRINDVLSEVGWPAGLRQIFTGNVKLKQQICAPRTSALTPIQDAADAEFPGVANVYVNAAGHVTFHGRFARFTPDSVAASTAWDFTRWSAGDDANVLGNEDTVVKISPPLVAFRDEVNLYTAGFATYDGIVDADIDGQYIPNAGAIGQYGIRTWSAENLLTDGGSGTTAAEELQNVATYYETNYSTPRTRVGQLTFKPHRIDDDRAAATWALMCGVDISDIVHLTTTHTGGGGFDDDFYVEGVHYLIEPMTPGVHNVTLTLDVSPSTYYEFNPWDP
jgi:hypothetical protein